MNIYLKVFIYSSSIYLKKKKVVKYGVLSSVLLYWKLLQFIKYL